MLSWTMHGRNQSDPSLAPEARAVVGHGQREENEEKEYRRNDDELDQALASAPDVHKEEGDEKRLDGSDGQSDGGVEWAKIDAGGDDGQGGSGEKRKPDHDVGS